MTLDLLAFGEVLWDIFQVGGPDDFRRVIGGAPANVAVQVARLGGRSAIVGAVGRDAFGDDLASRLRAEGVETRRTLATRAERTGIAFVLRTPEGQPRFLFYRQATADMAYETSDLPSPLPRARFALVGTSTLVVSHLARATRAFMRGVAANGTLLVSDLNVRAHLWASDRKRIRAAAAEILAPAHLVKASADDLAALDLGDEAAALAWVRARAPSATVFVTRGDGPTSVLGAFGRVDVPALRAKRCVDATGAGDGFIGGMVRLFAALPARSRTTPDAAAARAAATIGNAMGARVVQGVGALGADTRPLRATCERLVLSLTSPASPASPARRATEKAPK